MKLNRRGLVGALLGAPIALKAGVEAAKAAPAVEGHPFTLADLDPPIIAARDELLEDPNDDEYCRDANGMFLKRD